MRKLFILSIVSFILLISGEVLFSKRIYVIVDNAKLRKSLISMVPLKNIEKDMMAEEIGEEIQKIIRHDLEFTNVFSFVDAKDMTPFEKDGYEVTQINFKEWGVLGTEFLITGGYKVQGDGITFDARVYDVRSAKMILGKKYISKKESMRALAHRFSDQLMEELTGDKGIFQTKILFISDKSGYKELYVMDYDGVNIEQLTFHKSIVLSPAWAPDGKKVSYSGFVTHDNHIKNVDLFSLDLSLGKEKVISQKPGLNSGSSWSSTGKEIALTMSYEGNPEIYVMSPSGEDIRRLTQDMSLDVEPTWSPDGERLVFSSGRSPLAHLYVMNKEGGDIKRLTFAGKFNAAPSWSPKGDKIVFAGQLENHFDLFMVGSEGGNLARLTKAMKRENNEHPSWSANGRHIVFSSNRNGRGELYVIDDDGGNERPLLQKFGNISSPEWSSYLE
ncbi:MAG: Tol-Pal system beta propeller repeat protein TolB [Deltaproteobacteria bacterium GWA2_38_16]|nr:MAG: Tol-Pal system beta propeller repeat protein TolB [Deltaproteobacteria bacterium GWA2_38_16]OGQ02094.1 MAG: Tol-Pal system beta propeller repeat protein TolB [Deltaproteobacteria bacterium RIFCSPHIGHO2_02_FULL_38_15]OGQ32524.1 MAG: Tol-Pal system beta propeller repeat protein TolB [Deltaproteobacteria bacterium RIFCSPLOWO2_01_FULL_38_9]OGQ61647.1 MAG: Tol-Pal system beta propeller repeat protein TolB [Deltaproteobacteria bacterium RIFCSPLOWO2_12_FULL_38_8]HBQ21632.1 Tol-Pal system beta 